MVTSKKRFRHQLKVKYRKIEALTPNTRNARRHNRKQIAKLVASIREFGFIVPLLIDQHVRLVSGHARLEAAKFLALTTVPTIQIDHLTDDQKRAFVIADNRLAELAEWDENLLAVELAELGALDLDFDLEITGFETAEIDLLIDQLDDARKGDEADVIALVNPSSPPISRQGDVWLLGPHRILCGNALDSASYDTVMAGDRARVVFTDPPYNVPIAGHVSGLGRTKHREFVMASGEMTKAEQIEFLTTALYHHAAASLDGAILFVCMDWGHAFEILSASREAALKLLNLCVWNKNNGGMGSFYRSKHELVFVFKTGDAPHVNTIELGRHGRYRTNVWDYAGANSIGPERQKTLQMHPTVKPVALVADAIKDCSRRGDVVLDGFAGSGTTIIAADKTGRRARAIDLDAWYVDTAVRRWESYSGQPAIHADSGQSFSELENERQADNQVERE